MRSALPCFALLIAAAGFASPAPAAEAPADRDGIRQFASAVDDAIGRSAAWGLIPGSRTVGFPLADHGIVFVAQASRWRPMFRWQGAGAAILRQLSEAELTAAHKRLDEIDAAVDALGEGLGDADPETPPARAAAAQNYLRMVRLEASLEALEQRLGELERGPTAPEAASDENALRIALVDLVLSRGRSVVPRGEDLSLVLLLSPLASGGGEDHTPQSIQICARGSDLPAGWAALPAEAREAARRKVRVVTIAR